MVLKPVGIVNGFLENIGYQPSGLFDGNSVFSGNDNTGLLVAIR